MKSVQRALLMFGVAYVLNLIWERTHVQLYDVHLPPLDTWSLLIRATFWDAVIITGVYLLIDTKDRRLRYVLSAVICLGVAIFIEQRAFAEGRWSYLPSMPLMFGMGLSPLVQLPLLAIVTYEIVRRILDRK
jgi:hypothetical protein